MTSKIDVTEASESILYHYLPPYLPPSLPPPLSPKQSGFILPVKKKKLRLRLSRPLSSNCLFPLPSLSHPSLSVRLFKCRVSPWLHISRVISSHKHILPFPRFEKWSSFNLWTELTHLFFFPRNAVTVLSPKSSSLTFFFLLVSHRALSIQN